LLDILNAYQHKLQDNAESTERMQMLISNLELEKKTLNLRLWEANISKIELAAEVTRQGLS
jgi:hypothetical protein